MTVTILRHAAHEGPGYLAEFLERRGIACQLVRVDCGDAIPDDAAGLGGLVVMGGPMSANDPLPWIPRALALIQRAVAAGVPVLGHCLGGQLMARALGAAVRRNPLPEIGWHTVEVVADPVAKRWLDGLPQHFPVYQWHGDTFEIPAGATHLLRSADCPNQAFALGPHLGLQFHVELTPAMVADWAGRAPALVASRTVQSGAEMLRDVEARSQALQRVADVLYARWLEGVSAGPDPDRSARAR